MNEALPHHIVILGGGSAGWMAASLLAHRWSDRGARITLVESSDIGIIGVGEGSTPQLKAFFDMLGISESEWMPACNATYKTGIEFKGWSERPGFEHYFHSFPTAIDGFTANQFFQNCLVMRSGRRADAHPDDFFLPAALAKQRKAPVAPANFPFEVSYGYHFDAGKLGEYLKGWCVRSGVRHLDSRIASAEVSATGAVEALVAEDGSRIAGDFFIDASGFRAMIVEQALGEPHRSFESNLFNDCAIVAPTATEPDGPRPYTRATALSAGWAWQIPLTHRVGNGYVYSSRFIDREAAESELRDHLSLAPGTELRHLSMRVGRVERSWASNCLAIGLAQGFLEPLEATALHIVLATVIGFIDTVEENGLGEDTREAFNAAIARRYEGIRDYLVCHYRAARRGDSDYWKACRSVDDLSDSLRQLITCWFTGGDLVAEVQRQDIAAYYSATSWHCLFAGYGNFPDEQRLRQPEPRLPLADMDFVRRFIAGCAMNFPPHLEALERIGGLAE